MIPIKRATILCFSFILFLGCTPYLVHHSKQATEESTKEFTEDDPSFPIPESFTETKKNTYHSPGNHVQKIEMYYKRELPRRGYQLEYETLSLKKDTYRLHQRWKSESNEETISISSVFDTLETKTWISIQVTPLSSISIWFDSELISICTPTKCLDDNETLTKARQLIDETSSLSTIDLSSENPLFSFSINNEPAHLFLANNRYYLTYQDQQKETVEELFLLLTSK